MNRFYASIQFALIAIMLAMNSGLPFWRHEPIGDAFDFGLTTFLASWFTFAAIAQPSPVDNRKDASHE